MSSVRHTCATTMLYRSSISSITKYAYRTVPAKVSTRQCMRKSMAFQHVVCVTVGQTRFDCPPIHHIRLAANSDSSSAPLLFQKHSCVLLHSVLCKALFRHHKLNGMTDEWGTTYTSIETFHRKSALCFMFPEKE